MIKPLKCPNLPRYKVRDVAASNYSEKLIEKLYELEINPVIISESCNLDVKIRYHTDMLINNISESIIIGDHTQNSIFVNFLTKGYKFIYSDMEVKSPYPYDCCLNTVLLKEKLICNLKTADRKIMQFAEANNYRIIPVNQSYTKCSVCVVSDNAIITDDESVYKSCTINGIDTLLVSKSSVKLDGFDYGFIGGCSGLIDKNKLLFNGDLNFHKDCNSIIDFLYKYNIVPIIIENEPLYDIGSILPLTEEIPDNT